MSMTGSSLPSEEMATADLILNAERRWEDANLAAQLLGNAPDALGGAVIVGSGPALDAWLAGFRRRRSDVAPLFLSGSVDQQALVGGLDLFASLGEGREVRRAGAISAAGAQRPLIIRGADGLTPAAVSSLAAALDAGMLRSGLILTVDEVEPSLAPLSERLAFRLNLDGIPLFIWQETNQPAGQAPDPISDGGQRPSCSDEQVRAVIVAALRLGITSFRAPMMALAVACGLTRLEGSSSVDDAHLADAVRLVLGPKALRQPDEPDAADPPTEPLPPEASDPPDADTPPPPLQEEQGETAEQGDDDGEALEDQVIAAAAAGAVHLALGGEGGAGRQRQSRTGRAGQTIRSPRDGHPVGSEPGDPRRGRRLDVLATLRAAAPWQKLRPEKTIGPKIRIYPSDMRVVRYAHKMATTVLFVVDASGSAAMHRLAEAKGAVEALLSECYSRRDSVGLITFRGLRADLTLPPCRSLSRARRAMAGLPGGGGTPLPSAMALSLMIGLEEQDAGRMPLLVFLTDGKANIALDGAQGRAAAMADTERLAGQIADAALPALFLDTSQRPDARAQALSRRIGATYQPLPYADHKMVSAVVGKSRDALKVPSRPK